jgi:hypothetical protein
MTTQTDTERHAFDISSHPWNERTSTDWITALTKRMRQKYGQQVYWISCDFDSSHHRPRPIKLPSRDELICKGWFKVYVRPGNNEAHFVIMEWERHRTRPGDPHQTIELVIIKDDRGIEHALDIARWLTLALY